MDGAGEEVEISVAERISELAPEEWDALAGADDPFLTHAFLLALEESGSVGPETGWIPLHLAGRKGGELVCAAPFYLKSHSYGEYIFDWGWAEAAQRAGIPYYPKLVCAAPFTPASARRFLCKDDEPELAKLLWRGAQSLASACGARSVHILFQTGAEHRLLEGIDGSIPRLSYQFHWENPGVADFGEWLDLFRSRDRKKIRQERRKAGATVDRIYMLRGHELGESHIERIWSFYNDTCSRKWGQPYLAKGFFESLRTGLAEMAVAFLAEKDGEIVASSLCFQRGRNLYGRYWGCSQELDSLHFELCYHRPIELCIQEGWTRFEAGAQGQHKIKRGLLPCPTYSTHWLEHRGLSAAVKEAMEQEARRVGAEMGHLRERGPLRSGPRESGNGG
jgi:uncharacterized protein